MAVQRNAFQKALYNARRAFRFHAEKLSRTRDEDCFEAVKAILEMEQQLFRIEIGMLGKRFAIVTNESLAHHPSNSLSTDSAEFLHQNPEIK